MSSKESLFDNDICPTEGVPYWEHSYIYSVDNLRRANQAQKQFYNYFKAQFLKGNCLDVEDNYNYVFVLMYDFADEYKKHKNYDLLKQQLNSLAEKYPAVSSYIDKTIDQAVTLVKEKDLKRILKKHDKSKELLCRWVASGDTVEVQGVKLTRGNFYLGYCFRLPFELILKKQYSIYDYYDNYIYGPTLNPELPANNKEISKNVFCSYKDMSPSWRYEYLMWLSGDRNASDVPTDILLFYIYGCEIRMFFDKDTNNSERENILLEMINIYKSLLSR